ncbi:MAG: cell division protein FtsL [Candidatus Aminicenantales bacterium]
MIRKKYSKREIAIGILFTLFIISIFTFYIWHQMESIRLGIETAELEQQLETLKEEVKQLKAKKAELLSLERVERLAREELDLSRPEREQIIYEDENQSLQEEIR